MRGRRYQKPKIKNKGGYWIAQYRDLDGRKRKVSLGPVAKTKKFDAEKKLARILEPINTSVLDPYDDWKFGPFLRQVFLPVYKRKWKESTTLCNLDRFGHHLLPVFGERSMRSIVRQELQEYLDAKAAKGLSYSVVAHLRWDLRQIFRLAVAEGILQRNPAEMLFVPAEASRPEKKVLSLDQVRLLFAVLDLRERVMAGLALIAGMRPGEIFALKRASVDKGRADIQQRIYRGRTGTPKTFRSRRWAALGDGLLAWLGEWRDRLPDRGPDAWLFPSEKWTTPLSKDNCWRRHFLPRLQPVGLGWATFQVMRRTHACLLAELDIDPQVRAEQMGHSVDVQQNEYTRTSLERRRDAVNTLEKALGVM